MAFANRRFPANRTFVTDLGICNQSCTFDEQRTFLLHEWRPDQIILGRHCADTQLVALLAYAS